MKKEEAMKMIDDHKNKLINPVEMLMWTWLRVIILSLTDEQWDDALGRATATLSR